MCVVYVWAATSMPSIAASLRLYTADSSPEGTLIYIYTTQAYTRIYINTHMTTICVPRLTSRSQGLAGFDTQRRALCGHWCIAWSTSPAHSTTPRAARRRPPTSPNAKKKAGDPTTGQHAHRPLPRNATQGLLLLAERVMAGARAGRRRSLMSERVDM